MESAGQSLHHAFFQVSSVMTTTGFSTADFNLWPSFSKAVLLCLMVPVSYTHLDVYKRQPLKMTFSTTPVSWP